MLHNTLTRIAIAAALCSLANSPLSAAFNLDTGFAGPELIIPIARPIVLSDVSPGGSDPSLVLRFPTLISTAWFDATAPYHPTAVGIYTRLGRRPAAEATQRNINIALIYSAYRVLHSLLPHAPPIGATWCSPPASIPMTRLRTSRLPSGSVIALAASSPPSVSTTV